MNYLVILLKCRFQFNRSGGGAEILYFHQTPRWCTCCWFWEYFKLQGLRARIDKPVGGPYHLFLQLQQFYGNRAMPIQVLSGFHTTVPELNSCNQDDMARKTWDIYDLASTVKVFSSLVKSRTCFSEWILNFKQSRNQEWGPSRNTVKASRSPLGE